MIFGKISPAIFESEGSHFLLFSIRVYVNVLNWRSITLDTFSRKASGESCGHDVPNEKEVCVTRRAQGHTEDCRGASWPHTGYRFRGAQRFTGCSLDSRAHEETDPSGGQRPQLSP